MKEKPPPHDLSSIAEGVERRFRAGRRVLTFAEYLELYATDPIRYARDASRYVRDMFEHYGTTEVTRPWGTFRRYNLFDTPWEPRTPRALPRGALVGQEYVQDEVYRALLNFVREGKPNRLILLHGPNGSAKSTIVACIMSALEHYSTCDEGALYRFSWVFPSGKTTRGALGFSGAAAQAKDAQSYAHLSDDQIDARLVPEVRDHPLFLIPMADRAKLLERAFSGKGDAPSEWISKGELSHKSQQVFEALLSSYGGSYTEVLKHVRVERYFISRRYRVGAVTVGPQMSVDAGERQLTADRSLQALPASLQAVALYEAKGELVDAAGGILEFSDILKRPLDAFKYLQLSIETGEVGLTAQNVQLNCVMLASANELHLDAFREHPEFASFRGRFELIRVPYLRSYLQEQAVYETHVASQVERHVAPHATFTAAFFSVLTRMRKPNPERYERDLASAVSGLTVVEKADLYALGRAPERLDSDTQKLLTVNIAEVFGEADAYPVYEGRVGASPREMRMVLLDAAQSQKYACLSPLSVLDEIEALCERRNEFEWLGQDPLPGGYHDTKLFRETLLARLLSTWEEEFYAASGLIEEQRYAELFEKYVQHVSAWVKGERLFSRVTQKYEDADERTMVEVERLLEIRSEAGEFRKQFISAIAAWSLDHPGVKIEAARVFPQHLRKMRETIFSERKKDVAAMTKDLIILVREEGKGLNHDAKKAAEGALSRLQTKSGYCPSCAADAAGMLLRKRFADLIQ